MTIKLTSSLVFFEYFFVRFPGLTILDFIILLGLHCCFQHFTLFLTILLPLKIPQILLSHFIKILLFLSCRPILIYRGISADLLQLIRQLIRLSYFLIGKSIDSYCVVLVQDIEGLLSLLKDIIFHETQFFNCGRTEESSLCA